eukprot:647490-Hanusia_phi.AAC.2
MEGEEETSAGEGEGTEGGSEVLEHLHGGDGLSEEVVGLAHHLLRLQVAVCLGPRKVLAVLVKADKPLARIRLTLLLECRAAALGRERTRVGLRRHHVCSSCTHTRVHTIRTQLVTSLPCAEVLPLG